MENMHERDNAGYGCILLPRKVYAYVMAYLISFKIKNWVRGFWRSSHSSSRNWMEELSFKIEKLGGGSVGGACVENYN